MFKTSRSRGRQRGAVVMESALTILLLVMITIGTLELGRAVWCYNTLPYAVRQATRYAIVHGSTSTSPATETQLATTVARNAVGLDSSALTVTTTWLPNNQPGSAVRIRARYNFSLAAAFYIPATMSFFSTSQMVIVR